MEKNMLYRKRRPFRGFMPSKALVLQKTIIPGMLLSGTLSLKILCAQRDGGVLMKGPEIRGENPV
jgi:hypothetical protein